MTKQHINRIDDCSNIEEYCIQENGSFKIVYSDGTIYDGGFENDVQHGTGKLIYPDGTIYDGGFENGVKDGTGKIIYPDGITYEGKFKNDVKDGKGKMIYTNGHTWEGEFVNDILNGNLTIYTTEEKIVIFNGTINKEQKLTGDCKCNYYGNNFTGKFMNNLKVGNCTYVDNDGNKYEGEFENDVKNGTGKMTYSNGDIYEGEFKNGKFNGEGKLTRNEEFYTETYDGKFENGIFNVKGKLTRFGKCNGHEFNENFEGHWSDNELNSKSFIDKNRLLMEIREYEGENRELKTSLKNNKVFIAPTPYYTG
jgi:hypothetical protein